MTRLILSTLALLATVACGMTLPPITIAVPPPASTPATPQAPEVAPSAPADVPPAEPALPVPEVVEPPAAPLVNLNIVVHDAATGAGIPRAVCTIGAESRSADGGGFINFAVRGPEVVRCAAGGYEARVPLDLPPGDHRVPLVPIAPPTPPPAPAQPPVPAADAVLEACGARQNDNRVSDGCLMAVASTSKDYELCNRGNAVACHRYVREVATALRTATGDPGWGLITKFQGQGCTLTACSQALIPGEQKYGEDMVAYLPKGNPTNLWTGIDVIIGAGAPGARYGGGVLPPAVGGRPDNRWAPVP